MSGTRCRASCSACSPSSAVPQTVMSSSAGEAALEVGADTFAAVGDQHANHGVTLPPAKAESPAVRRRRGRRQLHGNVRSGAAGRGDQLRQGDKLARELGSGLRKDDRGAEVSEGSTRGS